MDGLVGGLVDGLTDYLSILCRFIRAISRQPIMKCNDARTKQLSVSLREQGVFITLACVAWRFCRAGRTSGEAARTSPAFIT